MTPKSCRAASRPEFCPRLPRSSISSRSRPSRRWCATPAVEGEADIPAPGRDRGRRIPPDVDAVPLAYRREPPAGRRGPRGRRHAPARVGFRRLRVAFSSFGGEFRTPALQDLRGRAKKISGRLAAARDLDVFLGALFEPPARANGSADAFAVLRARAGKRPAPGLGRRPVSCVLSPGFAGFMHDLGDALDRRSWREGTHAGAHATKGIIAFEAPATQLAERMLGHRLAHAKKRARRLEQAVQFPASRAAHRSQEAALHRRILRAALRTRRRRAFLRSVWQACRMFWARCRTSSSSRSTLEHLVEGDDGLSQIPMPNSPSPPASSMAGTSKAPPICGRRPCSVGRSSPKSSPSGANLLD